MTVQGTDTVKVGRIGQIRDIVAETFSARPGDVEAARSFEDELDTNSLLAINLLVALEEEFGVSIHNDELPRLMMNLDTAYEVVAECAGW
jgi:acyl carrier protein